MIDDDRKPVHNTRTGELVGWLTKDRFIPVGEEVSAKESRWTTAVMRNLQQFDGKRNSVEPIGASFPSTSVEDYAESAKRWLSDHSELKTKTIEKADYSVAYNWFIKGES